MGLFIDVAVAPALASDPDARRKLAEVCPVDIFRASDTLEIVDANVDECTLCELCLDVGQPGQVEVRKLYADGERLTRAM